MFKKNVMKKPVILLARRNECVINALIITLLISSFMISCKKADRDLVKTGVGESFTIELKANWSAGYQWSWINRDDITVADSTGRQYVIDNPGLEGSPGTEIWTFKAKAAGEETLIFTYNLPWSPGKEAESRKIRVSVRD